MKQINANKKMHTSKLDKFTWLDTVFKLYLNKYFPVTSRPLLAPIKTKENKKVLDVTGTL